MITKADMFGVAFNSGFIPLQTSSDGLFQLGHDGIKMIWATKEHKVEFIVYEDKTLAYVKSAMGYPAIYPLREIKFEPPADAVLMDLDGTSVHSEQFWVWIIEQTTARLRSEPSFRLEHEDAPFVSGHSVSEHLRYCIEKYCPDQTVEQARKHYFEITRYEMNEILHGRGKTDAFVPAPGLKEFLLKLKENNIKIGLVTSGLYEKAWPEIISAFNQLGLGKPEDFYDAIITAGYQPCNGQVGTLGELSPKPHPWLYAETACVGLGIDFSRRHKVIAIEDSAAGVVSIRLAGFAAIGIDGGNIESSGVTPLETYHAKNLLDSLKIIFGTKG